MARRGKDKDDDEKAEEASAAREFLLARLAVARGNISAAASELDEALSHFGAPDQDTSGKLRAKLLESCDAALAEAARGVQMAMGALQDIDPTEEEPDDEDEDE